MAEQGKVPQLALFQHILTVIPDRNLGNRLRPSAGLRQPVRVLFSQLQKGNPHILKALQKPGGKGSALAVQNHTERLIGRYGFFIHAVSSQRVKAVSDRHYLGANRYAVSFQSVGISRAIPALVVIPADLVGILQILLVL